VAVAATAALAAAAGLSLTQWARRKLNEAAGKAPPSSKGRTKRTGK